MKGPTVTINRSCRNCDFCKTESYRIQSESGRSVYCAHSEFSQPYYIGDTDWTTPKWCPECPSWGELDD